MPDCPDPPVETFTDLYDLRVAIDEYIRPHRPNAFVLSADNGVRKIVAWAALVPSEGTHWQARFFGIPLMQVMELDSPLRSLLTSPFGRERYATTLASPLKVKA